MTEQQTQPPAAEKKKPQKKSRKTVARDHSQINVVEGNAWLFLADWVDDDDSPTGQKKVTRQLTDCLLTVNGVVDEDGVKHLDVTLTKSKLNADGEPYWETHPSKPLPAEVMENAQKWNAWATAVGGCSWNLDHASRWELKKYLFAQPGAHKIVYKPKTSGYVAGHGVWLGRGFCFDAQGFAKPVDDERGTVDLECADGAIRSFSIPPIAPRFSPSEEPMTTPLRYGIPADDLQHVKDFILEANLNLGHHGAAMGLGWVFSVAAWHKWISAMDSFPILYVTGPKLSGKDTLCRWMWEACGFSGGVDAIQAIQTTTLAGVREAAMEVGNLPMWVNELRNDDDASLKLQGWVRSMFDAQTTTNANRNTDKKPRRALMCSGQDILGSDAEYTRYLLVDMPNFPVAPDMRSKVEDHLPHVHRAFCHLSSIAAREWATADLVRATTVVKRVLRDSTEVRVNDRQLFCYAVPLVGLAAANERGNLQKATQKIVDGKLEELVGPSIVKYACKSMSRGQVVNAQDSAMGTFWDALQVLHARGNIKNEGPTQWAKLVIGRGGGPDYVAVWFTFLLRSLLQMDRFGKWSKRLLLAEMRQVRGFMADDRQVRMGEFARECVVFDKVNALPMWVNELCGVGPQTELPISQP